MRITIIAVGKLRDRWVQEGCEEYLKRLRPRLKVDVIEVKAAQEMARQVPPRHRVWALDERGEEWTSVGLSERIKEAQLTGVPGIALLIGGADGLPKEVLGAADQRVSLSRLTLPHRLVRVLILEQLYRALSILHDEPYHRA